MDSSREGMLARVNHPDSIDTCTSSDASINQFNQRPSTSNEHYIHSRLKSTLSAGPKEIPYTGIVNGDSVRRTASMNAEARTKLVYASPKTSSHLNGSSCPSKKVDVLSYGNGINLSPSQSEHPVVSPTRSLDSSALQISAGSPQAEGIQTSMQKSTNDHSKSPGLPAKTCHQFLIKDSSIEIVDVMKSQFKLQPTIKPEAPLSSSKRLLRSTTYNSSDTAGFLKRQAAINARACVYAMMGEDSTSKIKSEKISTLTSLEHQSVLGKRPRQLPSNSNHNNSKKKKEGVRAKRRIPSLSELAAQSVTMPSLGLMSSSSSLSCLASDLECMESLPSSSSNEDEDSSTCDDNTTISIQYAEDAPYNCLGLLYNSDSVHNNAIIQLTTKGHMPEVILPLIVPQKKREVNVVQASITDTPQKEKKRPRKGDNGWAAIGNPIKTINIMARGGKSGIKRSYYIGIKRKDEKVFVRDCILVRSGRKRNDNPYVAKVASFWQETDGLMATVYWYYRPEDVDQVTATYFHDDELMASQHHDDVGVACIDDTCHVLGLAPFCRYRAREERNQLGISTCNIVPPCSTSADNEQEPSSQLFTCQTPIINVGKGKKLTQDKVVEDSVVYLCYRAYNHFAGKILRVGHHK